MENGRTLLAKSNGGTGRTTGGPVKARALPPDTGAAVTDSHVVEIASA